MNCARPILKWPESKIRSLLGPFWWRKSIFCRFFSLETVCYTKFEKVDFLPLFGFLKQEPMARVRIRRNFAKFVVENQKFKTLLFNSTSFAALLDWFRFLVVSFWKFNFWHLRQFTNKKSYFQIRKCVLSYIEGVLKLFKNFANQISLRFFWLPIWMFFQTSLCKDFYNASTVSK